MSSYNVTQFVLFYLGDSRKKKKSSSSTYRQKKPGKRFRFLFGLHWFFTYKFMFTSSLKPILFKFFQFFFKISNLIKVCLHIGGDSPKTWEKAKRGNQEKFWSGFRRGNQPSRTLVWNTEIKRTLVGSPMFELKDCRPVHSINETFIVI